MKFATEHHHDFSSHNQEGEKRTFYVLLLTLATMVAEIVAGTVYGSMALLADGWHMGTHAAAFCITLFAYRYAKKMPATIDSRSVQVKSACLADIPAPLPLVLSHCSWW